MNSVKWAVFGIVTVVVLIIAVAVWPFVTISPGEKGIVLRVGKIDRVIDSGFHVITPFLEGVVVMDIQTQKEQVDASAASKDLQTVNAKVAINYNLDADKVSDLYTRIGTSYGAKVIDPAVQEAVKAATANYTAEELITKRPQVTEDIKTALVEKLGSNDISVTGVSITDFQFSPTFEAAIEAKVTAEQNALAAKNKLDQVKYEAQQTIETAKATAEAQRISSAALAAQGGADYVQLQAISKWDGHLPTQMIPNSSVPFLNLVK